MIVVVSEEAVKVKYQGNSAKVLEAVAKLKGTRVDASGLDPDGIRAQIDAADPQRTAPVFLIGGYDLLPAFQRDNPTARVTGEVDNDVVTDAPYGARPGSEAEEYLPTRAVSRLPDSGRADASQFIAMLRQAARAKGATTPAGSFEHAAGEFKGSAQLVHQALKSATPLFLSPPEAPSGAVPAGAMSGKGRVHILLHGADTPERWDRLYGAESHTADLTVALRVADLAKENLAGAVVAFSTCYAGMLDRREASHPRRGINNQPALACLVGGAKIVYGSTRANWIDVTAPFDSFGCALVAMVWQHLRQAIPAAEALRRARFEFAKTSLSRDAWSRPYVLKTLLQTQCYGHPQALL